MATVKKITAMAARAELPSEIIEDILYRLPAKSLVRFKCVSKLWNSVVSEYNKTLLQRNRKKMLLLHPKTDVTYDSQRNCKQSLYSVDLPETDPYVTDKLTAVEIKFPHANTQWRGFHGSCNGLVLAVDVDYDIYLLNPTTGESRNLCCFVPHLNSDDHYEDLVYGLGYDSSTDDYKVVLGSNYDIFLTPDCSGFGINFVYSLKTNRWRYLEKTFDGEADEEEYTPGLFVNGYLHWLLQRQDGSPLVARFNLATENLDELVLPQQLLDQTMEEQSQIRQLYDFGGCFCFVVFQLQWGEDESYRFWDTYIWVMKEYGARESWTKILIPDPYDIAARPICLIGHKEILFEESEGDGQTTKVISFPYNMVETETEAETETKTKRRFRCISIVGIPSCSESMGIYVESLVSLDTN